MCHFDLHQDHAIEYAHILIEKRSSKKILRKKNSAFLCQVWEIHASFLSDESDIKEEGTSIIILELILFLIIMYAIANY